MSLEKLRETRSFCGQLITMAHDMEHFTLPQQIGYFHKREAAKLEHPLKSFNSIKRKYPDNIQMLAFGYASVFVHLLGNITKRNVYLVWRKREYFDYYFKSDGLVYETQVNEVQANFYVKNNFGRLRFVSCGSLGIEQFPFIQFVSVYDVYSWVCIIISVAVLSISIVRISGKTFKYKVGTSIVYITKFLLEQGDPFPAHLANLIRLRFVISGALLAGLVLSNGYKSTNVYNIVTPRNRIPFQQIDELLQQNYTVYSRMFSYVIRLNDVNDRRHNEVVKIDNSSIDAHYFAWRFFGTSEIWDIWEQITYDGKLLPTYANASFVNIVNKVKLHSGLYDVLKDVIHVLDPLVRVGLLDDFDAVYEIINNNALNTMYLGIQNNFIKHDLETCNKSAWILPDYMGQGLVRALNRIDKNADVGISEYTEPYILFYYSGIIPYSMLRRVSFVMASGVLEWWPSFINKTGVYKLPGNVPPTKPSMSGNIQVIFVLLVSGLLVGIVGMVGELRWKICLHLFSSLWTVVQLPSKCKKHIFT